jgi:diadenosine tetraphosphate (Ap4A) HIT family hydrolase
MNLPHASTSRFPSLIVVWQSIHFAVQRILGRSQSHDSSTPRNRLSPARHATCLFCQDDGELNKILRENKTFYVRLDNFPAADGHVEIVPKRHVVSFFELTRHEVLDAYELIAAARDEIARLTEEPHGYTIGVNEGEAAGRTIGHLHIHLIPRRLGDVEDPRGGIRQVLPNNDPDAWAPNGFRAGDGMLTRTGSRRSQ